MIGILCSLLFALVYGWAGSAAVKYYGFFFLYIKNDCLNFSGSIKYFDSGMKVIESDPFSSQVAQALLFF